MTLFCCPGCGGEISPQSLIPGLSRLTPQQQELITILATKPGHYFKATELAAILWADAEVADGPNSIDVQVSRIRKRLGRNVIGTRKGLGYRLTIDTRHDYVITAE